MITTALRRFVMVVIVVGATVAASPASADPKVEAKTHIDRATELYDSGKYAEALNELNIAYTLDPQPELLYAIAQVHVGLGQCAKAITYYERFLSGKPKAGQASAARQAIEVCKTNPTPVEPPPEPEPEPVAEPPPPEPVRAMPPRPPEPVIDHGSPWYRDWIGHGLVFAGVIAGAAGVFEFSRARADLDDAEAAATYPEHTALADAAHTKRTYAVVLGATGLALIGAGVIHYVVHAGGHESRGVAIAPTDRGGMVTWLARF